ncbi:MAG: hypothetical protein HKO89_05775, partial [Saprospiraceae bacterium]|nr:hypothetical protein [Saprospiraceae bacterium]
MTNTQLLFSKLNIAFKTIFCLILLSTFLIPSLLYGQEKFNCEGQVYAVDNKSTSLFSLSVNASNNSVRIVPLFDLGVYLDPLGFRPSDQLI